MSAWGGKWHSSFDMHVMTQERGTHAPTTPTSTTFGTKSPHPSWQLAQLHELRWQTWSQSASFCQVKFQIWLTNSRSDPETLDGNFERPRSRSEQKVERKVERINTFLATVSPPHVSILLMLMLLMMLTQPE